MIKIKFTLCLYVLLFCTWESSGQHVVKPTLDAKILEAFNRTFSIAADDDGKALLRIEGQPNPGVVWIKDLVFESGTIEFDVRGKDVFQKSFVGIAFHGVNDTTYQALYFRPFNFQANDPVRKKHAVQYIAVPENDWPYLRETFPDKYEAPMHAGIDPNDWFHVKIIVKGRIIETYINRERDPILSVQSLHPQSIGRVGFWTGHESDGDFANLEVIPLDQGNAHVGGK